MPNGKAIGSHGPATASLHGEAQLGSPQAARSTRTVQVAAQPDPLPNPGAEVALAFRRGAWLRIPRGAYYGAPRPPLNAGLRSGRRTAGTAAPEQPESPRVASRVPSIPMRRTAR